MDIYINVYLNYKFTANTNEDLEIAKAFFENLGCEIYTDGLVLYADGECEQFSDPEPIEVLYLRRASTVYEDLVKVIGHDVVLEGTIDTSEAAGEYMDFRFEMNEGEKKCYCTDYYQEFDKCAYMSYEDFCEEFGNRYSQEQFDAITDEDSYFVVRAEEAPMGDYCVIVKEVPFHACYHVQKVHDFWR